MGKYDEYVFTIPQQFHNWYGNASPRGFYKGNLMIPDSKFYQDFTSITKPQPMEHPHTHHAVDEYLVFANADLNNFFDWDAEVDIWLGDDPDRLEMFTLTDPTIVRVPPRLYHCPINFRRVDKPLLFSAIYLDQDWSKINRRVMENGEEEFWYDGQGIRKCVYDRSKDCVYCGKCFSEKMESEAKRPRPEDAPTFEWLDSYYEMAKLPRTGKYDKYVHTFTKEYHDDTRFLSPRAGLRGTEEMPGSKLRYLYDIVLKEGEIGKEPHMHHAVEEYFIFSGSDVSHFFEFGAEVEFLLGDDPDHLEAYTITEPTVVRIPAGLWHGPITVKKLSGTIHFMPFYPSGEYGEVVKKDGKYEYEGTDLPK
jgi:mannose-6-phosphate isomerase-like protein (cupin superfamily)